VVDLKNLQPDGTLGDPTAAASESSEETEEDTNASEK